MTYLHLSVKVNIQENKKIKHIVVPPEAIGACLGNKCSWVRIPPTIQKIKKKNKKICFL